MQWKTVTEYVVGQSPKDLADDYSLLWICRERILWLEHQKSEVESSIANIRDVYISALKNMSVEWLIGAFL